MSRGNFGMIFYSHDLDKQIRIIFKTVYLVFMPIIKTDIYMRKENNNNGGERNEKSNNSCIR